MDATPAAVPKAKQAGEIRARWGWVEPEVWTDRMLTALEQGVKGGKWFSFTTAGPMPSLPNTGCSPYPRPARWPVNPLRGEPPTGEPCAGEPHARFGGGRSREKTGPSYLYRTLPVYENKNGRDLARPFPVISGQGLYREQGRG